MSKRFAFRILTAVLIFFVSAAAHAISVKTEMVPMRDGTKLATDIGLPDGDGPWPTILIRTPYSKLTMYGAAGLAVQHGYACAVQDMRGRFDSQKVKTTPSSFTTAGASIRTATTPSNGSPPRNGPTARSEASA
jgi:hypothetical protein